MSVTDFWLVARRPRWIGALILALAIAGGFAALGQWQLARSFDEAAPIDQESETISPLESIAEPQQPVFAVSGGQRVRFEGSLVAGDFTILSDRINLADPGYWVVGHAIVAGDGASIAVALGWCRTVDDAASAIRILESTPSTTAITGRYLPSEAPTQSDFEGGVQSALAVAELVNQWETAPDGVYGGYVVADDAAPGLEAIDSPEPITEVGLNLLNVFYAIEWVVFAGFAVFLWYRLVRDAFEAELEGVPDTAPVE